MLHFFGGGRLCLLILQVHLVFSLPAVFPFDAKFQKIIAKQPIFYISFHIYVDFLQISSTHNFHKIIKYESPKIQNLSQLIWLTCHY